MKIDLARKLVSVTRYSADALPHLLSLILHWPHGLTWLLSRHDRLGILIVHSQVILILGKVIWPLF